LPFAGFSWNRAVLKEGQNVLGEEVADVVFVAMPYLGEAILIKML